MNENQLFDGHVVAVWVALDGVLYRFDRQAPEMPNARDRVIVRALLEAAAEQVSQQITEAP